MSVPGVPGVPGVLGVPGGPGGPGELGVPGVRGGPSGPDDGELPSAFLIAKLSSHLGVQEFSIPQCACARTSRR